MTRNPLEVAVAVVAVAAVGVAQPLLCWTAVEQQGMWAMVVVRQQMQGRAGPLLTPAAVPPTAHWSVQQSPALVM